jgi:hypothetical protein
MSKAIWVKPGNIIHILDGSYEHDEEAMDKFDSPSPDDAIYDAFSAGWIRARMYSFGLHINGMRVRSSALRGQVKFIVKWYAKQGLYDPEKLVYLLDETQGFWGDGCDPSPTGRMEDYIL